MNIAPEAIIEETKCFFGTHPLVCECGDALRTVELGSEWAYESMRTGRVHEVTPNPLIAKHGWDGLAEVAPGAYSSLKAQAGIGTIDKLHTHAPTQCPNDAGHHPEVVPECCGSPMWFSPEGWTCRKRCAGGLR